MTGGVDGPVGVGVVLLETEDDDLDTVSDDEV